MPVVRSHYQPPLPFRNAHLNTIFPNYLRQPPKIVYERIRLDTPDGDFMDVDTSTAKSDTAVVVVHGLEGSSHSHYILSMAGVVNSVGWDAVSVNMRGCSGEGNRLYSAYHSGKTEDLQLVLHHLRKNFDYRKVFLLGFSLGGNLVLKYAGEQGSNIGGKIDAVAAVSVPCDLRAAAYHMKDMHGSFYLRRLIRALKNKALEKAGRFPGMLDLNKLNAVRDFRDFDDLYTAPAHGFKDAEEYWRISSSKQFMPAIQIPAYLLNAKDDPFLAPECYPFAEAEASENFFFEAPEYGGHVGFMQSCRMRDPLYDEERIIGFFKQRC